MGNTADLQVNGITRNGAPPPDAALPAPADALGAMIQALRGCATALDRMQTTLDRLVAHLAPESAAPEAAPPPEPEPSDPIGAGFSLTQADLAKALGLTSADVSVLCRIFKLPDDRECALVVRSGARGRIVNYHPRAIDRLRAAVASPPDDLDAAGKAALRRVQKKLGA
jgi:hypothetical protein